MAEYISSLQYVTKDGYDLQGHDEVNYHVRTSKYSNDEFFDEAEPKNIATLWVGDVEIKGTDIKSVKIHSETGLFTDELALDNMTAVVERQAGISVSRNTPIKVVYKEKTIGVYYNGEVKDNGNNQYQIYAESILCLLDRDYHNGGIYRGVDAGDVIAEIFGAVPYSINNDVASIKIYGYLPRATGRENLQQIILATGAAIRKNEAGNPEITILNSAIAGEFTQRRVFGGGNVKTDTIATAIQVTEHEYIESDETTTLYEGFTTETKMITFNEPMHSLICTGGEILEQGANYAVVKGTGGVKLEGKKYNHSTKIITQRTGSKDDDEKVYQCDKCTLIGPMNSSKVIKRLYNYIVCNKTISQDVLVEDERAGDIVKIVEPKKSELVTAAIQKLDCVLSGNMRASGTFLIGYAPQGIDNAYEHRILLDTSGFFTVPAGITDIRVVLIGGGHCGATGGTGENGKSGNYTDSPGTGESGAGGVGGAGGNGGAVIDTNKSVTPGERIQYVIGDGGTPQKAAGNTTFGTLSTANGMSGPYIDLITGEQFAIEGKKGIDGANGGESLTTEGGTVYSKGTDGAGDSRKVTYGGNRITIEASGGEGGGAAAGANGGDGRDGETSINNGVGFSEGGTGGNGANATIAGANATIYGCGGNGGNGGGGGGGGGNAYHPDSHYRWSGRGGTGGTGSAGGNGAKGCIIIYY